RSRIAPPGRDRASLFGRESTGCVAQSLPPGSVLVPSPSATSLRICSRPGPASATPASGLQQRRRCQGVLVLAGFVKRCRLAESWHFVGNPLAPALAVDGRNLLD